MIICSPQLGLSPDSVLGGEVFDAEILLGLANKGAKIYVLLPKGVKYPKHKNIIVEHLPVAHFPAILFNFFSISYVLRIKRKTKIDILRLHQPQFLFIPALLVKLMDKNIRVVATYHQFKESNFSIFTKVVNKMWDQIVCDSFAVKSKLISLYGINSEKILVVHNGFPNFLKPTKKNEQYVNKFKVKGVKTLLFMGFFTERKNPLFLLKVLSGLMKSKNNVVLLYWGKGELKKDIIKRAKELNVLDRIRFIEPIFGPEKNNIHNIADIFVHPSLDEGFALAPLEAMACAKPVIMNDSHSAKEAIDDGVNGYLCARGNVGSWTNAITKVLNSEHLRQKLGKNALKKAKLNFSWNKSAELHYKFFKNNKSW